MKKSVFALVCTFALVSCQTTQLSPTDLSSVSETGFITYESVNGTQGFADLISGRKMSKQMLSSKLYLPEECKDPNVTMPAVIIQHGSGSIQGKTWYPTLAKKLNEVGIAALVADSYSARGISDTSKNQRRLPGHNRLFDMYAAFRALGEIKCIDADRIGVTGYSMGGMLSRYASTDFVNDALGGGRAFKASLPVYPSCVFDITRLRPSETKVHYLLGERDDWTLAKTCVEDAAKLKDAGWDISYTIYPGGYHGWISDKTVRFLPKVFVGKDCKGIYIDDDGYTYWNGKIFNKRGQLNKHMTETCASRGAHSGSHGATRRKSMDFTVEFFKENL